MGRDSELDPSSLVGIAMLNEKMAYSGQELNLFVTRTSGRFSKGFLDITMDNWSCSRMMFFCLG